MFCVKFGWNWSSGSGEQDENMESLKKKDRRHQNKRRKSSFGEGDLSLLYWKVMFFPKGIYYKETQMKWIKRIGMDEYWKQKDIKVSWASENEFEKWA